MSKLVLFLADGTTLDVPLSRERTTIGRRPDNDVCLPYPAVSGDHAAVVTIFSDSFLEDLGSTNGTLVNGKRAAKHFLRDGDEIDIGRQRLVYRVDDAARVEASPQANPPDIERFVAAEVGNPRSHPTARAAETPAPSEAPPTPLARLRVMTGPSAGREIALDKPETTVGRVGVQVAAVRISDDSLKLVPIEGGTQPRVNGEPVGAEGRTVQLGDRLEIANVTIEIVPPA